MARLFVALDNQNGTLVKNPALPCQSQSDYVFYKAQIDELVNKGGTWFTVYELMPVKYTKSVT